VSVIDRRQLLSGLLASTFGAGAWSLLAAPVLAREAPDEGPSPAWVERLAQARIAPWEGGSRQELVGLRAMNPEYDLMTRTFTAMGLADLALQHPDRWLPRVVAALDAMIADTTSSLEAHGQSFFLMGYGQGWQEPSLFVDGEHLLVMALRRLLRDEPALASRSRALGAALAERMASTRSHSWPSYPDECWAFCNTLALSALRALERLDGTAYGALARDFVSNARRSLLHPETKMLLSAYTAGGRRREDPEGSSIWASTHFLRAVDATFAQEQYELARDHFGRVWLGFGFGREWVGRGAIDVDSGPVVPLVGASPSSSGLAILAARSAGDRGFSRALHASLGLFALPRDEDGLRTYRTSNALGDAVILAGCTAGPVWEALGSWTSGPIAQGRG
jgi:hypothetical protein